VAQKSVFINISLFEVSTVLKRSTEMWEFH